MFSHLEDDIDSRFLFGRTSFTLNLVQIVFEVVVNGAGHVEGLAEKPNQNNLREKLSGVFRARAGGWCVG